MKPINVSLCWKRCTYIPHEGVRANLYILSDMKHASLPYNKVRNVLPLRDYFMRTYHATY